MHTITWTNEEPVHYRIHLISWRLAEYIGGLAYDCSNSGALILELLQFCAEPSIKRKLTEFVTHNISEIQIPSKRNNQRNFAYVIINWFKYVNYRHWNERLGPILLTWFNFNHSKEKQLHTVEVREWISNFIPHITGHVNTYPCWY